MCVCFAGGVSALCSALLSDNINPEPTWLPSLPSDSNGTLIQRTGKTRASPATLYTANCTVQHHSLLLLTPCVHCSKYSYLVFSPLITLQVYASAIKSTLL